MSRILSVEDAFLIEHKPITLIKTDMKEDTLNFTSESVMDINKVLSVNLTDNQYISFFFPDTKIFLFRIVQEGLEYIYFDANPNIINRYIKIFPEKFNNVFLSKGVLESDATPERIIIYDNVDVNQKISFLDNCKFLYIDNNNIYSKFIDELGDHGDMIGIEKFGKFSADNDEKVRNTFPDLETYVDIKFNINVTSKGITTLSNFEVHLVEGSGVKEEQSIDESIKEEEKEKVLKNEPTDKIVKEEEKESIEEIKVKKENIEIYDISKLYEKAFDNYFDDHDKYYVPYLVRNDLFQIGKDNLDDLEINYNILASQINLNRIRGKHEIIFVSDGNKVNNFYLNNTRVVLVIIVPFVNEELMRSIEKYNKRGNIRVYSP